MIAMVEDITFKNHLLVAMPGLTDPLFHHSVVYLCEHHHQGSIGLIINKPFDFSLQIVFNQLNIVDIDKNQSIRPVLLGGPIQPERGFVLHRPLKEWRSSLMLQEDLMVTTSNDIIHALAKNAGPKDALVVLGFSGWEQNQLEQEVKNNVWLICPFHSEILFEIPFTERWAYAGSLLGINMNQLSFDAGHA